MAQGSTPESAGSARPFKYHGKQGEFTLLAPFKPGGAERAREKRGSRGGIGPRLIGTLHNIRIARSTTTLACCSLRSTTATGTSTSTTLPPSPELNAFLDELWGNLEGYPGLDSPDVKDYLVKYQVPVDFFWTALP